MSLTQQAQIQNNQHYCDPTTKGNQMSTRHLVAKDLQVIADAMPEMTFSAEAMPAIRAGCPRSTINSTLPHYV